MKKLAIFTILVLICGTTSPSLVNHAYGQNDPSILLRIAVQADKQIISELDQVYGNQIPNNIQILYDNGKKAVQSLDESLSNDDVEQAKQDFLLAMNSFMQISRTISHSSEQISQMTVSEKSNKQLSNELDRLVKYSKTLEKLSKKYNPLDKGQAVQSLNEAERNGKVLTGLLYINPEVKDHAEILNISDTPLNQFTDKELCPGCLLYTSPSPRD